MYSKVIIALIAGALAQPMTMSPSNGMSVGQAVDQCGNDQTISCCNTEENNKALGVLNNAFTNLLGGSCSPIPVNVLGVQVPLQQACGNNQAACCSGSQNGLLNVQCTPIGF